MTATTRALTSLVLAIAVAAPAFAGQNPRRQRPPRADEPRGPEVTERWTRTLKLARGGTFDLANLAGDITITGGGGDEVRIDAVKRARGRDDADARAQLERIEIEIIELSNRIEVRTMAPGLRPRNAYGSVDFTIALPQDANVAVRNVSGNIQVSRVRGELRAQTVSGNVTMTDTPKLSVLRSVSGDITLNNGASETALNVNTVSGSLIVKGLKSRSLDVGSVSGDVLLDRIESERVNTRSVSGNVRYGGALARNGRYEFSSHSGDILLELTSDTGFDVEASTFNGDVRSDYALTLRGSDDTIARRTPRGRLAAPGRPGGRPGRGRTLRGSFGDGSASVELQSFSGAIAITKR